MTRTPTISKRLAIAAIAAISIWGGVAQAAPAPPFRLAVQAAAGAQTEPSAPCAPAPPSDVALAAYAAHLQSRLDRAVLVCPVSDPAKAGALLASGGVDMAPLDPMGFAAASGKARALLAPRLPADFGRVEIVFAALSSSSRTGPGGLGGARLALAGTVPVAALAPVRVATDAGQSFAAVLPGRDPQDAIAMLRANKVDIAAFHAAAWRRLCRGDGVGQEPCKDFKVVYAARPQARLAFATPLSMPDELRYRLIGINIALHLEAPAAFAYVARIAPGATSIDPAEASALVQRAP